MSRPKILIIENSTAFTGAFKSIITFTNHLSSEIEFFFCLPSQSKLKSSITQNIFVLPFLEIRRSFRAIVFYFPYLLINSIRIHNACKSRGISIIHINDLYNMCGIVMKLVWPSYKVVYHVRLMPGSYVQLLYTIWMKLILKYTDAVICVSNAVKKGIPESSANVLVIHDALPVHQHVIEREPKMDEGTKLLYLANYVPGKGQDHAIWAFKQVVKKIENCSLTFAGSDMGLMKNQLYKKQLMKLTREFGLEKQIFFCDFIPDSERLIKSFDILLNFSESESFSMTCLEAMAYGTAVIATDSGGPADLIENGKTGLLVENRNREAMVEAISSLCLNAELRNNLARAAKARAEQQFSLMESAEKLKEVYLNL